MKLSELTTAEVCAEIQRGVDDVRAGRTLTAEKVRASLVNLSKATTRGHERGERDCPASA